MLRTYIGQMPNDRTTAGAFLSRVMQDNGRTTTEVARETGMSPGAIRRALRDEGQRSRQSVIKLAAASGMTAEQARRYAELAGYPAAILNRGTDWRQSIVYLTMLIEAIAGPSTVQQVQQVYSKLEPAAIGTTHHGRRPPTGKPQVITREAV